jgi:starch phosphorylase
MAKSTIIKTSKQPEGNRAVINGKGSQDAYNRHLVLDHVVAVEEADQRERFEAVARSLRDLLAERWLLTRQTQDRENPKRVYYLSLVNNINNLGVEEAVKNELRADPRQDWQEVIETEPDAGLGNGGLGRLAACFIDSLATLQIPAMGYGLRYEYGIFRQGIDPGSCRQSITPGNTASRSTRRKRWNSSRSPDSTRTCSAYPSDPKAGVW